MLYGAIITDSIRLRLTLNLSLSRNTNYFFLGIGEEGEVPACPPLRFTQDKLRLGVSYEVLT